MLFQQKMDATNNLRAVVKIIGMIEKTRRVLSSVLQKKSLMFVWAKLKLFYLKWPIAEVNARLQLGNSTQVLIPQKGRYEKK